MINEKCFIGKNILFYGTFTTRKCVYTHTHTRMNARTYARTHAHTHTHTHTHTPSNHEDTCTLLIIMIMYYVSVSMYIHACMSVIMEELAQDESVLTLY